MRVLKRIACELRSHADQIQAVSPSRQWSETKPSCQWRFSTNDAVEYPSTNMVLIHHQGQCPSPLLHGDHAGTHMHAPDTHARHTNIWPFLAYGRPRRPISSLTGTQGGMYRQTMTHDSVRCSHLVHRRLLHHRVHTVCRGVVLWLLWYVLAA
jgi:hypothetical protein